MNTQFKRLYQDDDYYDSCPICTLAKPVLHLVNSARPIVAPGDELYLCPACKCCWVVSLNTRGITQRIIMGRRVIGQYDVVK